MMNMNGMGYGGYAMGLPSIQALTNYFGAQNYYPNGAENFRSDPNMVPINTVMAGISGPGFGLPPGSINYF